MVRTTDETSEQVTTPEGELLERIHMAVGHASMCWKHVEGESERVFDTEQALRVSDELFKFVTERSYLAVQNQRLLEKIGRVRQAVREYRSSEESDAAVPVGAVLAAIFINYDHELTEEDVERAQRVQTQIDADAEEKAREQSDGEETSRAPIPGSDGD